MKIEQEPKVSVNIRLPVALVERLHELARLTRRNKSMIYQLHIEAAMAALDLTHPQDEQKILHQARVCRFQMGRPE